MTCQNKPYVYWGFKVCCFLLDQAGLSGGPYDGHTLMANSSYFDFNSR